MGLLGASVRSAAPIRLGIGRSGAVAPESPEIVEIGMGNGEWIRAIVDRWGRRDFASAVVIPPAWGKTKETLLPLAATVLETFRRSAEPVIVVRFDGIRKRGESYNDPSCRTAGTEHHHFTFSQGVEDIKRVLEYVREEEGCLPGRTVLITFSASAIDGRRAVAELGEGLAGWISVVGAADLQSAMRVVSGGIDYLGAAERGIPFGLQEVQGVVVDMDRAAQDAIAHRLAFYEDARRDMTRIETPIVWIHGEYDAWMDLTRVSELLGVGDHAKRRMIVVPTGHQLRSSREALDVFQLIAGEVGTLTTKRALPPAHPDPLWLKRRLKAERNRRPSVSVDLRAFWADYLLGRKREVGIELMTATAAYQQFMEQQIRQLRLENGGRVADLGCGTGSFACGLSRTERAINVSVTGIDCVRGALLRTREQLRNGRAAGVVGNLVVADVDLGSSGGGSIPLADSSHDRVLASLLLSYLDRPAAVLKEIHRILRPGGRAVVSTLKPDADTSKIYMDGAAELRSGLARAAFGAEIEGRLDEALRGFLNDAARLLELEEQGRFHFWGQEELVAILAAAGFREIEVAYAFGDPPQAIVVSGVKS